MTTERTITIDPDSYTAQDVENISDMLCEIIAERYGHLVETLSFSIEATYAAAPDDTSEED